MTYKIYLREGDDLRLIAETEAEVGSTPNPGERWAILVDGAECPCEIEYICDPKIGLDGRALLSQDISVRKLADSNCSLLRIWPCWTLARDWDKLGFVIGGFLTAGPSTGKFATRYT